jgi:hypothetical protein
LMVIQYLVPWIWVSLLPIHAVEFGFGDFGLSPKPLLQDPILQMSFLNPLPCFPLFPWCFPRARSDLDRLSFLFSKFAAMYWALHGLF